MGSAFDCDGLGGPDTVLVSLANPELVCHYAGVGGCMEQAPHRMDDCSAFAPPSHVGAPGEDVQAADGREGEAHLAGGGGQDLGHGERGGEAVGVDMERYKGGIE